MTDRLTFQTTNLGRVRTDGIETETTVAPAAWVSGSLSYTWLDAENRETGEPLTLRARHAWKGRVLVRTGTGLSAALFGRYQGQRPFADTDGDGSVDDAAPAVTVWDARVSQAFGKRLKAFLGADNLFSKRDVRYYPVPGRRVYAGVTVRFAG